MYDRSSWFIVASGMERLADTPRPILPLEGTCVIRNCLFDPGKRQRRGSAAVSIEMHNELSIL